jgi:hypothetical protein
LSQEVNVVSRSLAKGKRVNALPEKLRHGVADKLLPAWVGHLGPEALGQPELVIRLPKKENPSVGGEALVP